VADISEAVATLAGVRAVFVEKGEIVAHADRDAVPALMTTLRDDPRFAFEQVMDICGVDWPERAERFDVVYNLLSVSLNQRLRVIVTTDENMAVPSVHTVWPVATLRTYEGAAPAHLVPQTRGRRLATMQGTMILRMRCRIRYYMDAHCGRRLDLYALVMTAPSVFV